MAKTKTQENNIPNENISTNISGTQEPKTFDKIDTIQQDFVSQDIVNEIQVNLGDQEFSKEEYLQQIAYYAEELVTLLHPGIYIGGHAQQVKDQLFEVLQKYKS